MTAETPGLGTLRPRREADPAAAAAWIEALLGTLGALHDSGRWQCPAHAGNSTALSVRAGNRGAVIYCHAGCTADAVLRALRLRRAHLFHPPGPPPALWRAAWIADMTFPPMDPAPSPGRSGSANLADLGYVRDAVHDYAMATDPDEPVARKVRWRHPEHGKAPRWESLEIDGTWIPGLGGRKERELDLYRWPEVHAAAESGAVVVLAESESSADALFAAGLPTTTWAGGASSVPEAVITARLAPLGDRVAVIPDNDDAGRAAGDRLAGLLPGSGRVLGDPGEDARDLLSRIGPAALRALIEGSDVEPLDLGWLYSPTAPPTNPAACAACGRDDTYRVDGLCPFCTHR